MVKKERTSQVDSSTTSLQAAPQISLPKGGGAIRGIDEKFSANPVTGTGSLNIPIYTSSGRFGFSPQLYLAYDSGAGNGAFGLGWSLSLPSITRKTDNGLPQYLDAEESDTFLLSGAEDLMPVFKKDPNGNWVLDANGKMVFDEKERDGYLIRRYRPRIEGLFARIERWINLTDRKDVFWRSISRDNITSLYGKDSNSRLRDPENPEHIFSWLICQSYDDKGNAIIYSYKEEDSQRIFEDGQGHSITKAHEQNRDDTTRSANRYLKRIKYGNRKPNRDENWKPTDPALLSDSDWMFEVVFDYEEGHYTDLSLNSALPEAEQHRFVLAQTDTASPWPVRRDPFSSYRAGFEVRTYRLCQHVLLFHHFPDELGIQDYLVRSTEFSYTDSPMASFIKSVTQSGYVHKPTQAEANRYLKKSLPPLEFEYSKAIINEEIHEVDSESLENLPFGLNGNYQMVDLDGEGVSGILTEQGGGWFYKPNLGEGKFGPLQKVAVKPSLAALNSGRQQLLDLAGDGQLDLVELSGPIHGFYERTHDEQWELFTSFLHLPNIQWDDPNLRFVDLNGDGHADVLITENEVLTWYPSLAEYGFGPGHRVQQAVDEEKGPGLVFSDGTQSIYLADMSGDGLTDLVRIQNGVVCYWPNLGYCRFGAKVTMDNPPWFDSPEQFDQRRIRLADIDGSGNTDIIYLGRNGVDIFRNESGNRWSNLERLQQFPSVDNISSVMTADVRGNGTACLVWSSPLPGDVRQPMRYIDLMGGQKPHLLTTIKNSLGAETYVYYEASTKFYLADKAVGKPWITRLPFPVHVVERVETYDWISRNRFVTRYAYHHGYYDGIEREFRGFGLVEQLDTEEFAALSNSEAFPKGDNIDETSSVPPVLTKTWFHTGAYLDGSQISRQFEDEYYREPGLSDQQHRDFLLPDTVLPSGLSDQELCEATRALKGSILRQEIFALDESPQKNHPYSVSERNYVVKLLQPQKNNHHAVFFSHPLEIIDYHYERNPLDPRVNHALTLEVDDFGNILKSVAIGYGRRQADPNLSDQDQKKQAETLITYSENQFANSIEKEDVHRTPQFCETRTYELTGLNLPVDNKRFSFDDLLNAGTAAELIAYEQNPTQGILQKRLIEHMRTLYRRDDLSGPLPLGQLDTLALPFESYKLAFTPGLISQVYGSRVTDVMLLNEGRYVHSENDNNWWIPSGQVFYSPNPGDPPAQEMTFAKEHFFLPHRFRDPFGKTTIVTYDEPYKLLMQETRDPLQNRVTVGKRNMAGDLVLNGNDYRVLQPRLVMDANRDCSEVTFDALGMVVGTAIMGKPEENLGDSLDSSFEPDLPENTISAHLQNPFADAHSILKKASTRLVYDLFAYYRTRNNDQPQPAVVCTLARETHNSDLEANQQTKIQHSLSYSDGFGREIQKKIQAESGPTVKEGPEVDPRWVGSGWTIFNNKGKPVRQYEPFFSNTHNFEFAKKVGVSSILFYDPVERVVATLHPNHTYEKVVFDPWQQETWDVNDNVLQADPKNDPNVGDFFRRLPDSEYLESWHSQRKDGALGPAEQAAANKAAAHAKTQTLAYFDTLGRTFLTIANNRFQRDGNILEEKYRTLIILDIEGNQREVIDAKDRVVMRYEYDMLGNRIRQESMEAGTRWVLNDVTGKPIYNWDSRGHIIQTTYDALQRPTEVFLSENNGPKRLIQQTVYGETQVNPEASNLRGKVYKVFDSAGVASSEPYDFKGNLLRSDRRMLTDYKDIPDWSANPTSEQEVFTSSTTYDALNRPVTLTTPDKSVIRPTYNEANLLERIEVKLRGAADATGFVDDIDYNAKGQRELIQYGNGVKTEYEYDELTFRLIHLQTVRGTETLQDLSYTYDPVGNITHIPDQAQQTIYFNNAVVEPDSEYTYDAVYRLIQASGREHIGQASQPEDTWKDEFRVNLAHPHNGQAMRLYTEQYEYDQVGNILSLIHQANNANWNRSYTYNEASSIEPTNKNNRLSSTTIGQNTESYSHDTHGNMTSMPHLPQMAWDFKDMLQMVDLGGGGKAYYVYDAGGQRVRKVWEKSPGLVEERIYVGGFEVFRRKDGGGNVTLERETLHIMDDTKRIAMVETRTLGDDSSPEQLIRFQFGNHLGSASLELGETGQIISYEEYYPYGSTSYQAVRSDIEVPLKRYRYTGKERDEESGFYYHGARYYVAWLGRWTSCDPLAMADGNNLYTYAHCSPTRYKDPSGLQNIPLTDADIDTAVQNLEGSARSGQGRRTIVRIDIGDPNPISQGGRWDDPANKQFQERLSNQVTQRAAVDPRTAVSRPQISLADAAKQGPEAFRRAAGEMLSRPFSEVRELETITRNARAAMRNLNRSDRDLANALNRAIRGRIARGATPEAQLVNRALTEIGIDPRTLTQMPAPRTGAVNPSTVPPPIPRRAPVEPPSSTPTVSTPAAATETRAAGGAFNATARALKGVARVARHPATNVVTLPFTVSNEEDLARIVDFFIFDIPRATVRFSVDLGLAIGEGYARSLESRYPEVRRPGEYYEYPTNPGMGHR